MPRPAAQRIPIDDLNLPTYLQTVLRNGGLETARDLAALSEDDLRTMPGVAGTSIRKIKMALVEHGLGLRPLGGSGYRAASKPVTQKETNRVSTRQPRKAVRRRSEP